MASSEHSAVNKLLTTLFYSANLDLLVKSSVDIIKNPIQVYDASYFCLAHSEMEGIEDPIWQMGKVGSNCLYEFATILSQLGEEYSKSSESLDLVYYDIESFSNHRRRIFPLTFSNELLGFLIVLEFNSPFESIPEEKYKLVSGVIVKELSVEQKLLNYRHGDTQKRVILDLMKGNFSNRDIFSLRLRNLKLTNESTYCIISANMPDYNLESYRYNYLETMLINIFPRAWTVLMQSHFLLLVDCANDTNLPEKSLEDLRNVMEATGLRAGISDFFYDLFEAPQYWQQAILAIDMAKKLHQNSSVVFFDQYKLWLCADRLDPQTRNTYVSSIIRKMYDYDTATGSQYVETLYSYLGSGKSLIKTGEMLHLHRNTIVYRLERMKELFGLHIGDSYEDMQNYLSCIFIYLSKIEAEKTKYQNIKRDSD